MTQSDVIPGLYPPPAEPKPGPMREPLLSIPLPAPRRDPPGMIAIPAQDWVWTDSMMAFINLSTVAPRGSKIRTERNSSSAAANRNNLIEAFLKNPQLEWMLFLDSDMIPPSDIVQRLLSHGVDCVGALAFQRFPPYMACLRTVDPAGVYDDCTDLVECEWIGGACMLVRRSVLERIPYPWFEHPVPGSGEDTLFCAKLRHLGIPVYCDMGVCAGHMASQPIWRSTAVGYHRDEKLSGAAVEGNVEPSPATERRRELVARAHAVYEPPSSP